MATANVISSARRRPIGYVTIASRKQNASVRRPYTLAAYAAKLEVLLEAERRKARRDANEQKRWEEFGGVQRELFN